MLRISKTGLFLLILVWMQMSLMAQNSTMSPYSRYGYGVIADRSFGAGRSMGGIGYGLRSSTQINPMNPASYSSMDSLTFLFDAGATLQYSWLNDAVNSHHNFNGNMMYLAMQFPLSKNLAMSAGLLPYSHTGYHYKIKNTEDNIPHDDRFTGTGGLNEVYIGLSIDIWKKRLALGINAGYLFGIIEHNSVVTFPLSPEMTYLNTLQKMNLRNFKYDLGMQYTHPLSKTERMTFGLTYSPKIKLSAVSYDIVGGSSVILKADTAYNKGFDIPTSLGAGVSYVQDYKLTVAADLTYQEWSKARFDGEKDNFSNRLKFVVGGEYIHNNFTRAYLSRIRYRAGVHYSNSYLKVNGVGYNEYGVSIGAGFPMLDNRSFINTSFEYVKLSPESKTFINERYFRFTLSFTFNELWFLQRRMD